jgi:hypothetical protein
MKKKPLNQKYTVVFLLLLTIHSYAIEKQILDDIHQFKYYGGIGLGYMNLTDSYSDESFTTYPYTFQIGYKFKQYFAIESRQIYT